MLFRSVTDQNNTASPLKLSTTVVQTLSKLQITTADSNYIDAEDNSGNNRFTVGRDPSSQIVNIDFASNPTGLTQMVGGIRTYTDGVNLGTVMSFRKDGAVGIGTSSPTSTLQVNGTSSVNGQFDVTNGTANFRVTNSSTSYVSLNYGSQPWATYNGSETYFQSSEFFAQGGSNFRFAGNGIFGTTTNLGARLGIKGSGSTSATTSLLVQNSGGTTSLSVNDAGIVTTGGDINAGNVQIGKGNSTGIYNVAMGQYVLGAGVGSSSAGYTVAIGQSTGFQITSGLKNVIIGAEVAKGTGTCSQSVIIGAQMFQNVTSTINNTLAIGTGTNTNYYPTIYATNILSDSPYVRIGNNSALAAAVPTAPNTSSILELSSTTTGFLPPRMTDAQVRAIATPAVGLMAYNTDLDCPVFYSVAGWRKISHSAM